MNPANGIRPREQPCPSAVLEKHANTAGEAIARPLKTPSCMVLDSILRGNQSQAI